MPEWRAPRFTTDRVGDAEEPCPVCGARSDFVYRCSECGADLCADYGGPDEARAPARDKPARFLDRSLERGTYVDALESMPPKVKLQQRIRGLWTVDQVQRYLEAELALDRPECPRQPVIGALNRRKAALEGTDAEGSETAANRSLNTAETSGSRQSAVADGGHAAARGPDREGLCPHAAAAYRAEALAGERALWCRECEAFLARLDEAGRVVAALDGTAGGTED